MDHVEGAGGEGTEGEVGDASGHGHQVPLEALDTAGHATAAQLDHLVRAGSLSISARLSPEDGAVVVAGLRSVGLVTDQRRRGKGRDHQQAETETPAGVRDAYLGPVELAPRPGLRCGGGEDHRVRRRPALDVGRSTRTIPPTGGR